MIKFIPWLKDFADLMIRPGRRVKQRDKQEKDQEYAYQNTVLAKARIESGGGLFTSALDIKHDWRIR